MPSPRLYDAHNHLQDERFTHTVDALIRAAKSEGVAGMVVNGSCEADWPRVQQLHRNYPDLVVPSYGYHPWYIGKRSNHWQQALLSFLEDGGSAVGEIGLDRWIKDFDAEAQEEVFCWQLRTAAERNLPVSIHCLQAWGRMVELLESLPRPSCGFVLHSYGGSKDLVPRLARLGAYFSLPGYFAHERKQKQRDTFRHVPLDRLLIETDSPDQALPPNRVRHPLADAEGKPINHPANLCAVYEFATELTGIEPAELAARVEANFTSLFGSLRKQTEGEVAPR